MSLGVINYPERMGRWQPDARGRLAQAALALYGERGFDNTTVEEIAECAGLTKRTFFRYFADKREVLFDGAQLLEQRFVDGVVGAPASAAPLDAVAAGLEGIAPFFAERREFAARRQQVIAANPELLERELIKMASLSRAVADALRRRGVEDTTATLTAEAGISVFRVAFERWVDEANRRPLLDLMRESLEELRALAAAR
jgi:AcrR family transcriptional regulator